MKKVLIWGGIGLAATTAVVTTVGIIGIKKAAENAYNWLGSRLNRTEAPTV